MRETSQDVPDFIEQVAENRYIFEIEKKDNDGWGGNNSPKTFQDTTEQSPTTSIHQHTPLTTANNDDW